MPTDKKNLTVFGATGTQGGSVINFILGDDKALSEFAIRGITRDVSKPASKALAEEGCRGCGCKWSSQRFHLSNDYTLTQGTGRYA